MATTIETTDAARPVTPIALWLWLTAAVLFCIVVARDGFTFITAQWLERPEYSHGILIPFIAAFLIWQRRATTGIQRVAGGWLGPAVVLFGLALWALGRLSTIQAVSQYALVVMLYGIAIAIVGAAAFRRLWAPMVMLLLAIPLPAFFYNNLSSQLQLISSALGVWLMRLFGISVYLSGNVIDLGHFQMQVVEACDGLRYLFPLMTLGFIVAYFFRAPLWQRLFVFASSVPLTIFMNSVRIAMIGIFADAGNTALAEGLLHELQGWVIFMASGALLLLETWLLVKLTMRGATWRDVLAFDVPASAALPENPPRRAKVPASLVAACVVLGAAAAASYLVPERAEATPERSWFAGFPQRIADWEGRQGRIEDMYLDALKLDDYVLNDYRSGPALVNLYAAYYASQRQGESIHSPRSCIPGGGWRITSFDQIDAARAGSAPLRVNRAVIQLGEQRQLVYYWFKQRDRVLTNEYLVKWYIFVDALTKQRTDGALVRLITPLGIGENEAAADERLQAFLGEVRPVLEPYIPD
ncbi:MAG TPA: VPLPA-CTERM-specific exosortase XrtD [Gammaproteobacteria bacterium]|nr:VPLPA-CTERM-specific exosortase XrtD [Gammaproteobacteria bacterium]